jgi:hypothetical protein
MAGVKTPWNWKASTDFYANPVPEFHPKFIDICSGGNVPLGKVVDKQRPTRLQNTDALANPCFDPGKVLLIWEIVVCILTVLLSDIEWRVSENSVHYTVSYFGEFL